MGAVPPDLDALRLLELAVLTAPEFPEALAVDGTALRLRVVRKRVRNLNARLREGTLLVSAPLRAERGWVLGHLEGLARILLRRDRRRDLNRDGAALAVARRVAARFPDPPSVERVEFSPVQASRWGSYSPATGTVRLSAVLRHAPAAVLEGVVAHELCHVRWRTHGPRFRALLRKVDPRADWVDGFLDGARWCAREAGRIPPTDRGPLGEAAGAGGDPPSVPSRRGRPRDPAETPLPLFPG